MHASLCFSAGEIGAALNIDRINTAMQCEGISFVTRVSLHKYLNDAEVV